MGFIMGGVKIRCGRFATICPRTIISPHRAHTKCRYLCPRIMSDLKTVNFFVVGRPPWYDLTKPCDIPDGSHCKGYDVRIKCDEGELQHWGASPQSWCFVSFFWKFRLPIGQHSSSSIRAQRPVENVKNTLQNITTEWTPHYLSIWLKSSPIVILSASFTCVWVEASLPSSRRRQFICERENERTSNVETEIGGRKKYIIGPLAVYGIQCSAGSNP